MSTSRDSCCLPSVKKQKHDFQVFAFVQCMFVCSFSVRVISLGLRLRLITLTSTLIILDITKTSSNNCLLFIRKKTELFFYHMIQQINVSFPASPRLNIRKGGQDRRLCRKHQHVARKKYHVPRYLQKM